MARQSATFQAGLPHLTMTLLTFLEEQKHVALGRRWILEQDNGTGRLKFSFLRPQMYEGLSTPGTFCSSSCPFEQGTLASLPSSCQR